jgi:hypothetical protein
LNLFNTSKPLSSNSLKNFSIKTPLKNIYSPPVLLSCYPTDSFG